VVASSCDAKKSCTLPDRVLRCDGSHTTSLRHQGDENASSPSDLRAAVGGFRGIHGLHDPNDLSD
jgi:hypothetical protein